MAFIKRSTTKPTTVKVGKKMLKCASCGTPFVSDIKAAQCPKCTSGKEILGEDLLDFNLDPE